MILETVCEYFLLKKCKLHSINIKVELENYNKVSRMMMSRFGPISDIVSISVIVKYTKGVLIVTIYLEITKYYIARQNRFVARYKTLKNRFTF